MAEEEPSAALCRVLLSHLVTSWTPDALRRSRRAVIGQAYAGVRADTATVPLRALVAHAGLLRGRRLAVVVLSVNTDLAVRLGAVEAELPPEVSVHLLAGAAGQLPSALRAAGAAGAPVLAYLDTVDGAAPGPEALAAAANGRPAEVLIVADEATRTAAEHRRMLRTAGFPLTSVVGLVAPQPWVIVHGSGSGQRLATFKETLWSAGATCGVRLRDPDDPASDPVDPAQQPDHDQLRRRLLGRLVEDGPCSVVELRTFLAQHTLYRPTDVQPALVRLLATGEVTRHPADGRLGGDVLISAAAFGPTAGWPAPPSGPEGGAGHPE